MIKLTIGNSECKIEGLSLAESRELRPHLSYQTAPFRDFYSGTMRTKTISLIDKRGSFPSGLLRIVEAWILAAGVTLTRNDLRKRPISQPGTFKLKFE